MGVSLGVSVRVLVDLESLNMAESVGNVTKHRKAPVVVPREDGYRLIYVPVISGMSLAHHYQRVLAHYAKTMGLPVTRMSLEGYFLKFSDNNVIKAYYPEVQGKIKKDDPCNNERVIVQACTVADVGGFLYTGDKKRGQKKSGPPVKRTSRFSFSYMMPALDNIRAGAVGVYPQIHARYTPKAEKEEQALIYVDNSSALYTLTFMLDIAGIGYLDTCSALSGKPQALDADERLKRYDASVKALIAMLGNMSFGAKRSRSLPHWRVESIVAIASAGPVPLVPSPGHSKDYIQATIRRAEAQKSLGVIEDYYIAYYADPEIGSSIVLPEAGTRAGSLEEAINGAAAWTRERFMRELGL